MLAGESVNHLESIIFVNVLSWMMLFHFLKLFLIMEIQYLDVFFVFQRVLSCVSVKANDVINVTVG